MSKPVLTKFQDVWVTDSKFKNWVRPLSGRPNYARCILCFSDIFLSNMGRQALVSHMKSKKHATRRQNSVLENFLTPSPSSTGATSSATKNNSVISSTSTSSNSESSIVDTNLLPSQSSNQLINQSTSNQSIPRQLDTFLLKNDITTAEILWCIETIMSHKSLRTAEKDIIILKRMIRDSEIVKKMQLKKDKIGYVIMFGIAPFFNKALINYLKDVSFIVVGFDESLNKITKRQQMDINVRFWDIKKEEVVTRYLTSRFLGRSRAMDLLEAFKKGIENLQEKKLLQISMDGPNVNWTFIKEYKSELSNNNVKLLDIGSCGLHSLHCAFKTAIYATQWDIISYMRAIYNIFKDVPARRALYTQYSESDVFPLKFCSIRWLENIEVVQRAINVTPHIKKFVEGVRQDKIEPTCKSFIIVAKLIEDPLLCAKLAFFKSLASDVEPFLREFQSDAPLVPFLHTALCQILKNVLERFMKPEVVKNVSSISLKDVQTQVNLLPAKNIIFGFDTQRALKKVNITTANMLKFQQDCKTCLQKFVCKLMNRSPLIYTLTKATTCLDPNLIASNLDLAKKRLNDMCNILIEKDRLTGSASDTVVRQFREITSRPYIMNAMKSYNRSEKRLDHFWRDIIGQEFKDFMHVVKMICCMSHGNANVERGFSINNECLFENMREESVIARRQVYDAVLYEGGIDNVQISKELLLSARNAHSRYVEYLEQYRQRASVAEREVIIKRKKTLEAKELEAKRIRILENAQKEANAIEEQIQALKK